ncbi:Phytanoyl-CoA dioxygenase [Moelleriella libera RCEF 2490]|uniref:Phytanoyl-CoA dioxygenase n=1 Tax=Moelleriella libera RCEF 2490 TaxID=1081109 RepID=A0A167VSA7_9HYPO|nr:Phytanoyl-CoA dioxygenase [Moelleriella libera RCEF 2490]
MTRASRLLPSTKPSLQHLADICSQRATPEQYQQASSIRNNVPIYDIPPHRALDQTQRSSLQDEWYHVLCRGPGVFVTKGLFQDHHLIDRTTSVLKGIISLESSSGNSQGDHFAGTGNNDRIWNSLGKHATADPASFVRYYSNPWLSSVCNSWLGPGYRITAQANNAKPGAEAQGVVAHVDVPLNSGPTRLLPFSQTFEPGYVAHQLPEFREYFLNNYVELPLEKGDGIFFNPALFHGAGENQSTDIQRMVNLLQVSSAFGKPMESLDSLTIVKSTWDDASQLFKDTGLSEEIEALLPVLGESYPFPTNLDVQRPDAANLAPGSEVDIIRNALVRGSSLAEVLEALENHRANRKAG